MANALRGSAYGYSGGFDNTAPTVSAGAFDTQPQVGDVISVLVCAGYTTDAPTISDNAGNTYTQTGTVSGNTDLAGWRFRCPVTATDASLIVTATWPDVDTYLRTISCAAVSGADTSAPIGVSGGQRQATGITTTDGTTTGLLGAPAQDGHFFHGLALSGAGPASFVVGTGFTSIGNTAHTTRAEYLIQGTAASIACTFTQDDTGNTVAVGQSIKPASASASCATSGTITSGTTEADIVTGGKTIILTLTGDTYVTAGATFDAQRQNIINGLDSAQAEGTGWDAVVKAGLAVTDVARTSDTVCTITLPAFATYNITATETITATVPATALTGAGALVSSPTFTVTASGGSTTGPLVGGSLVNGTLRGLLAR